MNNGSYFQAAAAAYETAFDGYWFYLILISVVAILLFLRNKNLGLLGVGIGTMSLCLMYLGKLPAEIHIVPYIIIGLSFGLTIFLAYTDRYRP
jgi:hypothetical protein